MNEEINEENDNLAIEDMDIFQIAYYLTNVLWKLKKGQPFALIGLRAMNQRITELHKESSK